MKGIIIAIVASVVGALVALLIMSSTYIWWIFVLMGSCGGSYNHWDIEN